MAGRKPKPTALKKLKLFVQQYPEEDFVLWNSNRALIKHEQFEKYMDNQMNVI